MAAQQNGGLEAGAEINEMNRNASVPISHLFDSSDDEQSDLEKTFTNDPKEYIRKFTQNMGLVDDRYQESYILTEISNRLLLSEKITSRYINVKDPLKIKIDVLNERRGVYEKALNCINKHKNFDEAFSNLSVKDMEGTLCKIKKEINDIEKLKEKRDGLNKGSSASAEVASPLKGALPFLIHEPVKYDLHRHYNEYKRLNKLPSSTTSKEIHNRMCEYLENNQTDITTVLNETALYTTDRDYWQALNIAGEKLEFLVQVRAYRKLNRDIQKSSLFKKDEARTINVLPENTTIKLYPTGSASLLHGQFKNYTNIPNTYSATLENYKNYITKGSPIIEKEKEFRDLSQMEAIRNTSALLTNAMFFDLVKEKFDSVRILASLANKRYEFANITEQMPMTMEGACKASTYLFRKFKQALTCKLPFDYRNDDMGQKEAMIVNIRNKNILFDWLSHQINIKELLNLVNQSEAVSNLSALGWSWNITNDTDTIQLNNNSWTLVLKKGKSLGELFQKEAENYVKVKIPEKLLKIKIAKTPEEKKISIRNARLGEYNLKGEANGEYTLRDVQGKQLLKFNAQIVSITKKKDVINIEDIEFNNEKIIALTKDFCLTEINSFPLSVFNNLIDEWYGITLLYLVDSPLKTNLQAV